VDIQPPIEGQNSQHSGQDVPGPVSLQEELKGLYKRLRNEEQALERRVEMRALCLLVASPHRVCQGLTPVERDLLTDVETGRITLQELKRRWRPRLRYFTIRYRGVARAQILEEAGEDDDPEFFAKKWGRAVCWLSSRFTIALDDQNAPGPSFDDRLRRYCGMLKLEVGTTPDRFSAEIARIDECGGGRELCELLGLPAALKCADDDPPLLEFDARRYTVRLNRGVTRPLDQDSADALKAILEARGGWITGTAFHNIRRPDRAIDRLPSDVRRLIISKRGTGYRLDLGACRLE
jgi:hypothetical protein